MSASIFYHPQEPGRQLACHAPSMFITSMRTCFGEPPWTLDQGHRGTLNGMAAVHPEEAATNPYLELLSAVNEHGTISVTVQY